MMRFHALMSLLRWHEIFCVPLKSGRVKGGEGLAMQVVWGLWFATYRLDRNVWRVPKIGVHFW